MRCSSSAKDIVDYGTFYSTRAKDIACFEMPYSASGKDIVHSRVYYSANTEDLGQCSRKLFVVGSVTPQCKRY
jgi:hypothetical protein